MYLHSDLTMRMFGTMQKCAHTHTHTLLYALTHTHTHTDSGVWSMRWCTALAIVFWLNAGGKWHWCVHLLSQYDVNIKSLDSSQPLSFISACCLIFAWAENGSSNVHCSCLSWGFWVREVGLVQRHMQRWLGLNIVAMLTLIAVSSATVWQPRVIKAQESAVCSTI